MSQRPNSSAQTTLTEAAKKRILILDGAMGTMIQRHKLEEEDYRGTQFADWHCDVKGNNDLLVLTQPDIIYQIHCDYFEAGADIIETNTFNATTIAMADYDMQAQSRDINLAAAKLARKAADEFTAKTPEKPRFVAGVLGPTNRTASISPDVNDPGKRNVTFDELVEAYSESTEALIEGGADLIMLETIFDTLNAKAAAYAVESVFEKLGISLPVMVSGTITDASGRTLSGQTAEAFYYSMRHISPFSFGLNCALGPDLLRQYVDEVATVSECLISAHPNAGLPNEFGEYDMEGPEMAEHIKEWAQSGLVNIVGGCCGSTPEHIRDIANAVKLVGVVMAIGGGFLGGLLAQKMRIMRAMMVGAVLACVTNLLFILLTYHPGSLPYMYLAVILDNLAAGLASAVFIAFLSALTSIRFTAVQYSIFSSLMTLLPKVIGGYSGSIVDSTSYPFFFLFTFALGIPILALIYYVDKHIIIGDNDDYDSDSNDGMNNGDADKGLDLTKANPNLTQTKEPPRASE